MRANKKTLVDLEMFMGVVVIKTVGRGDGRKVEGELEFYQLFNKLNAHDSNILS